ncbi:hypothetical protein OAS41_02540 [Candidatus Marinimicrobia bacterium]|nr:hypothetical protein [Candidatus Neomarinimicrobiota bacterium]MDB3980224.1 hypothetical protein [Candidatus Neomarinimicrobiota bacterium]MDC0594101.1 hypothetical protein [Candidatus Neomarinimicrobiota bacterium]MDC1000769.1 hypothetical protein [Candidatus Neomarinimicrobiota bacterium]MDC1021024.1 hypothetical protein [Candidatus Neomarinimicrobiota bacterium]|tara:strand:+ start:29267 stop:30025 length:759 start_codon:yes stop_codon:yes gene_type:complete
MLKRLFPSKSSRYKHIQNLVKRINTDIIDRLEIFFPMWIMLAFQHYLIKSYDIAVFSGLKIDYDRYYIFSMIIEDWAGIVNILFHSLLFLWLMKRYESFGPFRSVKIDCQTNFLLFLAIYSFIDILIFGKMMMGLFLMFLVLYIIYRSDSMRSKISTIILTMIVLLFSIYQDEPILSTSAMLYLPFLFATLALKSKEYLYYAQKYLLFIVFIFLSTKELWFGFVGLGYFIFFYSYYYFSTNEKYNWLKFDSH